MSKKVVPIRAKTQPVKGSWAGKSFGKKVRHWSADRPERPDSDPIHKQIMDLMSGDTRSVWQQANTSGLSTTTIYNWRKGKTKRPSCVSLQMAAAALGKKIRLE